MRRLILLVAALALIVPSGARAATAACGGLAPLDVRCETSLVPTSDTIEVALTTDPTFVGEVEISFTDGERSIGFPCVQASLATDCRGTIEGAFAPGSTVTMRAEILTVNRVVGTLPVEDVTVSIGNWTVTATV